MLLLSLACSITSQTPRLYLYPPFLQSVTHMFGLHYEICEIHAICCCWHSIPGPASTLNTSRAPLAARSSPMRGNVFSLERQKGLPRHAAPFLALLEHSVFLCTSLSLFRKEFLWIEAPCPSRVARFTGGWRNWPTKSISAASTTGWFWPSSREDSQWTSSGSVLLLKSVLGLCWLSSGFEFEVYLKWDKWKKSTVGIGVCTTASFFTIICKEWNHSHQQNSGFTLLEDWDCFGEWLENRRSLKSFISFLNCLFFYLKRGKACKKKFFG